MGQKSKLLQINTERINRNYESIPKLLEKYLKYDKSNTDLQNFLIGEHLFRKTFEIKYINNNIKDDYEHIEFPKTFKAFEFESSLNHFQQIKENKNAAIATLGFQKDAYIALIKHYTGQLKEAETIIDKLNLFQLNSLEDVEKELLIQLLFVRGMCYEKNNFLQKSIEQYETAMNINMSNNYATKEDIAYRYTLVCMRVHLTSAFNISDKTLKAFRLYTKINKNNLNQQKNALKHYFLFFVIEHKEGRLNNIGETNAINKELTNIVTMYSTKVFEMQTFPGAQEKTNTVLLEMIDIISNGILSLKNIDKKAYTKAIQILFEAMKYSYNLPRIQKYLVEFSVLNENVTYSRYCLMRYIDIVKKSIQVKKPCFMVNKLPKKKESISCLNEITFHTQEEDSLDDIIETLNKACIYFLEKDTKLSFLCSSFALELLDEYEVSKSEFYYLTMNNFGLVYHMMSLCSKSKEQRLYFHQKSIDMLSLCTESSSLFVEVTYNLAVRHACVFNTSLSISYLEKSLEANYYSLEKLHLLVLLLSSQKKYTQALGLCEDIIEKTTTFSENSSHYKSHSFNTDRTLKDEVSKLEMLNLKLTQNRLLKQVKGPEAALENINKLFIEFGKSCPFLDSYVMQNNGNLNGVVNTLEKTSLKDVKQTSLLGSNNSLSKLFKNPNTSKISVSEKSDKQKSNEATDSTMVEYLVNLWLYISEDFMDMRNLTDSLKAIEEAQNLHPDSIKVYFQFGEFYYKKTNYELAIESYTKGIRLKKQKDSLQCDLGLAKSYLETGDYEAAEHYLDLCSQGELWNVPCVWKYLGILYSSTNRYDEAKSALLYSLKLEQNVPIRPYEDIIKLGKN